MWKGGTASSLSKTEISGLRFDRNEASKKRMENLVIRLDEFLQTHYKSTNLTDKKIYRLIASNLLGPEGAIGQFAKRWPELFANRSEAFQWFSLPENAILFKIGKSQAEDVKDEYVRYDVKQVDRCDTNGAIDLDLQDAKLKAKFRKLLKKEGRVSFWAKKKEKKVPKTNPIMDCLIKRIETILQGKKEEEIREYTALRYLFLNKGIYDGPFGHLPLSLFHRKLIEKGSLLEQVLDDQSILLDARKRFENAELPTENESFTKKRDRERALLEYANAEQTFAHRLGIPLKPISTGGSGGARKYYDREGRPDIEELKWKHVLSVVKPEDEGPHGVNNPQKYAKIKRLFVSTKPALKGNSEGLAEQESYALDRAFDLNIVPPTDFLHVESPQFFGPTLKECSVQLFVENAVSLKDYFGIPGWIHFRSREYQRRYLENYFNHPNRKHLKDLLEDKSFRFLLEKVAFHDFATENLDCHLENVLIVEIPVNGKDPKDRSIQEFLKSSLGHIIVKKNGVDTYIALVKHDGGASNPHKHPTEGLSLRNKHLFEILPPFKESFSDEMKKLFEKNKGNIYEVLVEKLYRQLKKMDEHLKIIKEKEFHAFWEANRKLILNWIFAQDQDKKDFQFQLIGKCLAIESDDLAEISSGGHRVVNDHLNRIHANLRARMESWLLIENHFERLKKGESLSMRQLLSICHANDFQRELAKLPGNALKDFGEKLPEKIFYIEQLESKIVKGKGEVGEVDIIGVDLHE